MTGPFLGHRAAVPPALVTVVHLFVYKRPRACVPPPSLLAPQLSPLPGVHTLEGKRLTEGVRRPGLEAVCGHQHPKGWRRSGKEGEMLPSTLQARCLVLWHES